MNAIDPAIQAAGQSKRDAVGVVSQRSEERTAMLLCWLIPLYCAGALALAGLRYLGELSPIVAGFTGGLFAVTLSSLLISLAGLVGTGLMTWARQRAYEEAPPLAPSNGTATGDDPSGASAVGQNMTGRAWWRRWPRPRLPRRGDAGLIGRTARWPQAIGVGGLAAAAIPWLIRAASTAPPTPTVSFTLGVGAIVLAFPLLVAERLVAATQASRLPEARELRALLLLPVLAWPAAGLVSIATGLGIPYVARLYTLVGVCLTVIAAELCLRALARCFLPPPAPAAARAAVTSSIARMIAEGVSTRSIAEPVRQQFGIDFSRGWALSFLRAATPPVAVLLLLLTWALSGVVSVGLEQRAVYERLGAPVAVLHPGLHAILPWPMGQVRRAEFGVVHEMALTGINSAPSDAAGRVHRAGAEDLPPPEADRLWEQAHPGELTFLIASATGSQQSFQVVSADIKVRYRIGLTDQDVLQSAYRAAEPETLLRGAASRAMAGFFVGRTLDAVLGENRDAVAERLREQLQQELDAIAPGIELVAVVIEAIHPPAGAAEAYHAVQAATILAEASISAEQGRAVATRAEASQHAADIIAKAHAAGAEAVSTATSDLTRFGADHVAALTGGESFLLERRLTSLAAGLSGKTLTVVDHRIPVADAPVLDLRPQSAVTARSVGADQE